MKVVILILIIIDACIAAKLPNEIKACNYNDETCVLEKINYIFTKKYGGFDGLGLPVLDPLRIAAIDIVQGNKSPVNIVMNFKNITFSGLSKTKAYKASGFTSDPQGAKIDIRFKSPKIAIVGPYKVVGRVLVLPIQGEGIGNMTLDNVDFILRFQAKAVQRNGKTFMQIEKTKLNFETTRLHMHFTNLFNGNKPLGNNMNLFLNDNWNDILSELKTPIIDAFGSLFLTILSNVFNNIPYAEMFL